MFTYEIKNYKQIQEQASVCIEETSSGIFNITKNRYGSVNILITSIDVVEALKVGEKVAFLDINKSIHTNFIPVLHKLDTVPPAFKESVRNELSILLRPVKKERMITSGSPSHLVLFANEEDEQMNNVFIYEDQISQSFDFLKDKVKIIMIIELGVNVVKYMKTR